MKIILILILAPVAFIILFGLTACIYAGISLWRRPLLKLYEDRTREPDFAPFSSIPKLYLQYLLQIEDDEFFEHPGYNQFGIRDAISINIQAGKILVGGSTISQQLVKNLYFRFHHSYLRKAAELLLTLYAERKLGKVRILEFYENIGYYGNGIYGITHAARFYFGKNLAELTMNQQFMLACMLYAPTVGNPIQHPDVFLKIRDRRLNLLVKRKFISREDADMIRSYQADCLDPELRAGDAFTDNYPQDVRLINDRFGPCYDERRVTIP